MRYPNAYILIDRVSFSVQILDKDTHTGFVVGRPDSLEGAIEEAIKYQDQVKYGIYFS